MQVSFADPLSGLDDLNQATSLVGRENEMQVIRVLLNTVLLDLSGAHALNISGETGVGKSRLLAEMYREARTLGFQVLEGYAYETSNMVPYLPIIEALRSVFRFSSLERLRQYVGIEGYGEDEVQQRADDNISLIGAPLVTSLSRILPEIPKLLNVNVMPEIISPDQEKFRFLDAVATLLERMAQDQPVLLGIDNLQWADSATLELILYLTVRLHRSRVALVGATRPPTMPLEHEEDSVRVDTPTMNNAATRALMELISKGLLLLLPVAPLDSRAAAEHLHTLLPGRVPENIVEVLLARTEGNPFFLEELVRGLVLQRQVVLNNGV
ncbi:MAG: AAA family ATPase, partial [Ktedonobacteraceae bacterium]|nr:AAA family ATPase [Ktedonobacteraceae bacterium]